VVETPGLTELVAGLADNKYFLGRRYAEWCTAAPALEAAVAAAAMAQDEIGHARSLYPLLRDLAGDSPEVEPETRSHFTNARFLDHAFESWMDFVAANFLFDTALSILLEAARDSRFAPLAQRARRMLEEEQLHWLNGEGWVRRLSREDEPVRRALTEAIERIAAETESWLDIATDPLVEDGILELQGGALRAQYRARVEPVLAAAGLSLP
jgi:phenylacetate-CoA oxygenase PaaI subunit